MKSSTQLLQEIGSAARICEAASDVIFDECIAYLRSEQGKVERNMGGDMIQMQEPSMDGASYTFLYIWDDV